MPLLIWLIITLVLPYAAITAAWLYVGPEIALTVCVAISAYFFVRANLEKMQTRRWLAHGGSTGLKRYLLHQNRYIANLFMERLAFSATVTIVARIFRVDWLMALLCGIMFCAYLFMRAKRPPGLSSGLRSRV